MGKRERHIIEAEAIGRDSWRLLNYHRLPDNATAAEQVAALRQDQKWWQLYCQQIESRITRLINDIERGT